MKPMQKLARAIAKKQLSHVWLADGKCLDGLTHTGIYDVVHPCPAAYMRRRTEWQLMVVQEMVEFLAARPLEWSIWYGTFESDGDKQWVEGRVMPQLPPAISNDLGDDVHDVLEKLVKSRNPKYLISYGWIATPKKGADLMASHDEIVEKFREWGAFDRQMCELNNLNRLLAEAS